MPTYSLSGPDGAEYEIDAPDEGAAFKAFQSLGPAQNAPAATATDAPAAGVAGDASAAVGRGIINGVPVVGPALLGGAERLAAGIRSYQNGTPYADELQKVQSFSQGTAEAHPYASTAGNVAGGVVGTLPMAAAAPAAFGLGGGGFVARAGAGMLGGSALGAADSTARAIADGKDASDIQSDALKGAALGGVVGGSAPLVGGLVGASARKFYDMIGSLRAPESGFSSAATRVLQGDVANAGGTQAVQENLTRLGPKSMLLDAGSSLEGRAQGLAAEPDTMQIIADPLRARGASANARINADVDAALGPSRFTPMQLTDQIKALRQPHNDEIGAALRASNPVDIAPVLQHIDGALSQAKGPEAASLMHARELLNRRNFLTNELEIEDRPQALQNAKQAIDLMINYGAPDKGIQPGALKSKDAAIQGVRARLNNAMREQIPGYAAANDQSAALARRADALEAGYEQTLQSGRGAAQPGDLRDTLAKVRPDEQDAIRRAMAAGNRADIARIMGENSNDVAALRRTLQGEGGFNTEKMGILHGEEPVQRVADALAREEQFSNARTRIVEGAQSAQRMRAAANNSPSGTAGDAVTDAVAGTQVLSGNPLGAVGALAGKAGRGILNNLQSEANIARNQEIARALTTNPGEAMDRLLAAIQSRALTAQRAGQFGGAVGRGTQAALVSQGGRLGPYAPDPQRLLGY